MKDMYGMLIILGLLVVISQCINKEKKSYENFENSNSNHANTQNVRQKKLPQVADQNPVAKRNVFSYNPGEILLTDANSPYGFNVPPSMMQEFSLLRNMGTATDKPVLDSESVGNFARFVPTTSQYAGFDPTSKGGLLRNQVGGHVTQANNVSNNLQRNIANMINSNSNTNSNIIPSNSNQDFHASNVNSNRNVNVNSIITKDNISMKEGYANFLNNNNNNNNNNTLKKLYIRMIYAGWCPHSVNALPAYNTFIDELNGSQFGDHVLDISKYDVASDEYKHLSNKYKDIPGFPTVVVGFDESHSNYTPLKSRKKEGILNEIKGMLSKI